MDTSKPLEWPKETVDAITGESLWTYDVVADAATIQRLSGVSVRADRDPQLFNYGVVIAHDATKPAGAFTRTDVVKRGRLARRLSRSESAGHVEEEDSAYAYKFGRQDSVYTTVSVDGHMSLNTRRPMGLIGKRAIRCAITVRRGMAISSKKSKRPAPR